ncbi:LysR family transcriptional regulator [Streptomyces prunicolor]|uniref:LysR family transcriptional regulator n=1 Tax=Streptomyces prunicolor TaxID=67348 RepID=A0ABU4F281_9ACTN|nr:LysR family transcriptional regulator [Streptomyces prunicolor]MCX5234000.1 LysR family transcriptional regulator [Streptomyces prunicolor]MDV7214687.1 LysR family transcriptional regulator [Streptomyces prunicolor]
MQLLPVNLAYFLEVARTGSVTEAAHALNVAPSAISRQVAKLESGIGVPLFARHPRGMTLTEAGSRLLAHARRTETESTTLVEELRTGRGAEARSVAVACSEGFARRLVPRAIADFRCAHPDVAFRVDVVARQEATRRVVEGLADVAVTYTMGPQHDVRVECAVVVPVAAIVPLGHELADRDRIGLADLCAYPLALASPGTSQRELFDIGAQLEGITVRPALVCDSLAPQYEFVRAGGGLALVGDLGDIEQSAATEGVTYVPVDHPVFRQREAQVQTATGRRPSWSATQFTELLVTSLRRDRSP